MFKTRLLSGIVILILVLAFVITGGTVLLAGAAFLSLVGFMEFMRMQKLHKTPLAVTGYLAVILLYVLLLTGTIDNLILLTVFYLLALMTVYVVAFPKYKAEQMASMLFGFFYAGVLISYIIRCVCCRVEHLASG